MAENGEVLEKVDSKLVQKAVALDEKVCEAAREVGAQFVVLGKLLLKMKESGLWQHLQNIDGTPCFRRYEQYTDARVGKMARSRVFELLSVAQLSQGAKPIDEETVEKLGIKAAAEIAKLPEQKRTREVIREALKAESVAEVREQVRGILNEDLPASEKKEATSLFARQLPLRTIKRFEKLEARAIWMEGIRDGDKTLTLKQKFFEAMIAFFEEHFATELAEADGFKVQHEELAKQQAAEEAAAREQEKAAKAQQRAEKKAARKAEKSTKRTSKTKAKRGKTAKRRLIKIDNT